jgi:hypothetical protein
LKISSEVFVAFLGAASSGGESFVSFSSLGTVCFVLSPRAAPSDNRSAVGFSARRFVPKLRRPAVQRRKIFFCCIFPIAQ